MCSVRIQYSASGVASVEANDSLGASDTGREMNAPTPLGKAGEDEAAKYMRHQ